MKNQNPQKLGSSYDYASVELKLINTIIYSALICIVTVVGANIWYHYWGPDEPQSVGPAGTITDSNRIAAYDAEFADYIGSGHDIAEYHYVDSRISKKLDFGCGPLYDVAGYQVIIGKTGAVGTIAYGKRTNGRWDLSPSPDQDWETTFILVFAGCVAPEAWWNHPVLASILYGVPTTDGRYLPELMVWVPCPNWFDFDNPPDGTVFQSQSWYWDGSQYTPANFVDDRFPLLGGSQDVKTRFAENMPSIASSLATA